jgi:hypothetical protein
MYRYQPDASGNPRNRLHLLAPLKVPNGAVRADSSWEKQMLGTILIVLVILALVGALPRWPHSREWGYWPSGGLGMALTVVVILVLIGRI